ncbi:galactose mutarotase [Microbacterium sp. Root61]|uniref:aldose 1-epimerase family protein n=1 Tax=Microbacterium sp. Root61 TaxID=1736570 RepID=UPI0006F4A1F2|nr:galactose mutarotase [Microbacterium sp. Root61]
MYTDPPTPASAWSAPLARTPLSGIQHSIRAGDYEAVIAGVGASLRSLTYRDRDLVVPFDADEVRPAFRGATLAPWPNRVVDGTYEFGGETHQLPLTEPARGHALHGLVAWLEFHVIDKDPSHVTLAGVIEAQAGYPWRVIVETTFALNSEGLTQVVTARNDGPVAVPWGTAPHPYLVAGSSPLDEWTFGLPAAQVLTVTEDRLISTGLHPVEVDAARFDFRTPRPIGSVEIDQAFTGFTRDADGLARATVTDAAGSGVAMVWDESCPWVQIHTADLAGGAANPNNRLGLAIEPMTCAPDAFNAGAADFDAGLIVIEPGATATAQWRIEAIG